jgi:hypothetical protein
MGAAFSFPLLKLFQQRKIRVGLDMYMQDQIDNLEHSSIDYIFGIIKAPAFSKRFSLRYS